MPLPTFRFNTRQIFAIVCALSLMTVTGCIVQSSNADEPDGFLEQVSESHPVPVEAEPDLLQLVQQLRKAKTSERGTPEYKRKLKKLEAGIKKLPAYRGEPVDEDSPSEPANRETPGAYYPPSNPGAYYPPDNAGDYTQPQIPPSDDLQAPIAEAEEEPVRPRRPPRRVPVKEPSPVEPPRHAHPRNEIAERLEHANTAIEHLRAAEMFDLADQAEERAVDLKHQLRRQHNGGDHRDEAIEDLRREIRQLRNELKALQHREEPW